MTQYVWKEELEELSVIAGSISEISVLYEKLRSPTIECVLVPDYVDVESGYKKRNRGYVLDKKTLDNIVNGLPVKIRYKTTVEVRGEQHSTSWEETLGKIHSRAVREAIMIKEAMNKQI